MSLHDELAELADKWDRIGRPLGAQSLREVLARHPEAEVITVESINKVLNIDLWQVPSFRANVHVDFREDGSVTNVALANHPQLQVQAPVGEGLENEGYPTVMDMVRDTVSDGERGGLRAAIDSVVDAILAAGYREQTLPSVDDVAKVLAHTDGGHHEALFDAGHESTIALYMRHATAILDLLKRGA